MVFNQAIEYLIKQIRYYTYQIQQITKLTVIT